MFKKKINIFSVFCSKWVTLKSMAEQKILNMLSANVVKLSRQLHWRNLHEPPPEGDNAANYEKIQAIILKNLETIRQLRQENKTLNERLAEANAVSLHVFHQASHSTLSMWRKKKNLDSFWCLASQGDERLIREAFGNRGAEIEAYRSMSGKARGCSSYLFIIYSSFYAEADYLTISTTNHTPTHY